MARQGLNREKLIEASISLMEEKGYNAFSMAELAKYVHVNPSSLYNHIESLDMLNTEVGLAAAERMVEAEKQAIAGKSQDEALFAIADAYRDFAKTHIELYRAVMNFQKTQNQVLEKAAGRIVDPILQVLSSYGLSRGDQMHWQRVLRSVMHGFIAHEEAGGFSHFPADRDESYRIAIQCVADGLRAAGRGEK